MALTVRLARRADAEAIRSIYNLEVVESTVTFDLVPRSLEEQVAWLDEHSGGHPAIVAVSEGPAGDEPGSGKGDPGDGEVVGFGSLSPYRPRPAYAPTVEDSVYVHRDWRGRGAGVVILDELVRLATAHGFHSMIARIVGGHEASIALHRRCGFEQIGTEREVGRKLGRWLDVALMQRML